MRILNVFRKQKNQHNNANCYELKEKLDISIPSPKEYDQKVINNFYQLYINNHNLDENNKSALFDIIISNLKDDTIVNKADNIYSYLLRKKNELDIFEFKFFIQYSVAVWTKYQIEKNKDNQNYKDFKAPNISLFPNTDESFGKGLAVYDNNYGLEFKYEFVNGEKISKLLQVFFHEIAHYKQDYEYKHSIITNSAISFAKRIILDNNQSGEYYRNWAFKEVETEADIEGLIFQEYLLSKYYNKDSDMLKIIRKEREHQMAIKSLAIQMDDNHQIYDLIEYNVTKLSESIKNNNKLLESKENKVLKLFYYDDGRIKTEEDLLKSYKEAKLNKDIDITVFTDFFDYIYRNQDVLNNTNMDRDLLNVKNEIIKNLTNEELIDCNNIIDIILRTEEFLVQSTRMPAIKYRYEFLNRSLEKISHYLNYVEKNLDFDLSNERLNIEKRLERVRIQEKADTILEKGISFEEYEIIKRQSEEGDLVSNRIVEIITSKVNAAFSNGMTRDLLIKKIVEVEHEKMKDSSTNNMFKRR